MNLPNKLSLFRIFIVPIIVVLLLTRFSEVLAGFFFTIATITDWLDGYIARATNQVTNMGKLLDPIADKILISAAFISLVEINKVPAWMVVIIIAREFAVSGLRAMFASHGEVIHASTMGKVKAVVQDLAVIFLIFGIPILDRVTLWVSLVLTIVSGLWYFVEYKDRLIELS